MHRIIERLFLLGLRGTGLLSKFVLTLFIAKEMTLSDLGLYGLIAVGATLIPALYGLGLNGPCSRSLVNVSRPQAMVLLSTRVSITLILHAVLTPLAVFIISLLIPAADHLLLLLVAITLFLEHLATDINAALVARFKSKFAAVLVFIRSGAWPLLFIGMAWYMPQYRSVTVIVEFWLASLLVVVLICLAAAVVTRAWKLARFDREQAWEMIRKGRNFYISDIGSSGSLYLDRFLVTSFLGLEATGVYTFFWSLTNAINNVIFFGVTSQLGPRIIAVIQGGDKASIDSSCRAMQREIWMWCLGMSVVLVCLMPPLLAHLGNDKFEAHKSVLFIMLAAILLRTVSEGTSNILYGYHKDREIAVISLASMGLSALFTLITAPLFGLPGVAFAMLITALAVYLWRQRIANVLLA